MASNSPSLQRYTDQVKRSGVETPEHKKVKDNMNDFIDSIKSIPDGLGSLTNKFIEKEWLPTHAKDITADNLIIQALNRIKLDAKEHEVFLEMFKGITGADQIVMMFTVTQPSSTNPTAEDAAKHTIVSGMNPQRPVNPPPILANPQNKTLHTGEIVTDSALGSEYMSSSDTAEDVMQCPQSPPPGSLPESFTAVKSGQQTTVTPPLLSNGASVNFIPEAKNVTDQPDGNGGKGGNTSSANVVAPVPVSGGNVNIKAQQPLPEAAEYSPSPIFTVGSKESEINMAETQTNESLPVQSEEDSAKQLLSSATSIIGQRDELRQQNVMLKQQLSEVKRQLSKEKEEKEAISQAKEELRHRFESYKRTAEEKQEAAEKKLKELEQELEKCKIKLSQAERENEQRCAELEKEINTLKQEMNKEKGNNEKKVFELRIELLETRESLAIKENDICVKEKEIAELERKIVEKENEEIKKENEERKEREEKLLKEREESKERENKLLKEKEESTECVQKLLKEKQESTEQELKLLKENEVLKEERDCLLQICKPESN